MIVPVFLPHLGCGKRCTYCNQNFITGTEAGENLDLRERVASVLEPLQQPAEIALYSGNPFGLDTAALERLFGLFLPYRDRITNFRISAKPGPLAPGIIDVCKAHNVRTIELGAPSFNDRILALLERGHTREDIFRTCALLKEHGFEVAIQVMVGLPEETPDDLKETVSAIERLRPSFIRIYPLLVIEDTRLFQSYREGRFTPDDLETAVAKTAFIYASTWSMGIRTIKMGLTEGDVLKERIAAGPIHPAFGYLVKSEVFRLAVQSRFEEAGMSGHVVVHLNKSDVAHLTGYRRSNLEKLKQKAVVASWVVDPALDQGHFRVEGSGRSIAGSLTDALTMIPF